MVQLPLASLPCFPVTLVGRAGGAVREDQCLGWLRLALRCRTAGGAVCTGFVFSGSRTAAPARFALPRAPLWGLSPPGDASSFAFGARSFPCGLPSTAGAPAVLWGKPLVLQDPRAAQGCRAPAGGHAPQHPSGLTPHRAARAAVPQGAAAGGQLPPATRKINPVLAELPRAALPALLRQGGRWRRAAARPRRSRRAGERLGGDGPRLPQPLPLGREGCRGCAAVQGLRARRAGMRAGCVPGGPAPAGGSSGDVARSKPRAQSSALPAG